MNKIEIETKRDPKISGGDSNNILEIETTREPKVSGEQTNLTVQNRTDSTITLYTTDPISIIIQQRNDFTETVFV